MYVTVNVSPLARVLVPVSALPSISPEDEALNIPTSSTVNAPVAVNTLTSCKVSFVTVVVTLDTVAAALCHPLVVISVDRAVCPAAGAVLFDPRAK